ncbi:ATP-binding response regulator [Spirochaeta lutea]|uniref:histidine kinase n=1 Tax=Spirochaeta lutea TaxID=1480694 RepID=A0A098QX95_9SPIO|nr:response regulator [Spirochaeta lutea]KGE72043.1 hypothetical protein DC28_08000 [Spirochaeta lutea]
MRQSTVLIVEDDAISSFALEQTLEKAGFSASSVLSGEACLDLLRRGVIPDVILMDIHLGTGRMDGLETTRQLHDIVDVPVVLHTAYADPETLRRSRDMTKYGYVHKIPGNGAMVVAGIELALKLFRAERELLRREQMYRELSGHIQQLREDQEQKIAREIHDDLGQSLTALKMNLTMLDQEILPRGAREILDEMALVLDGTIRKVRSIIEILRPPLLDSGSLCEALEWYCRQFSDTFRVRVRWICDTFQESPQPPRDTALALFRIAQESMTNGVTHGKAKSIEVEMAYSPLPEPMLLLQVQDDGRGFSLAEGGWQAKRPGPLYELRPKPRKYHPPQEHFRGAGPHSARPGGSAPGGAAGRGSGFGEEAVASEIPGSSSRGRRSNEGTVSEPRSSRRSFGIIGMEERALQLGGWFILDTAPRVGTRVVAGIPWSPAGDRRSST